MCMLLMYLPRSLCAREFHLCALCAVQEIGTPGERIWSCGMPQKTYLVIKFVESLFGQEKALFGQEKALFGQEKALFGHKILGISP